MSVLNPTEGYEIEPMFDRILVRVLEPGKTPGGLVLPDNYQDENPRVVVIAVGRGEALIGGGYREPIVKPGDHVIIQGQGIVVDSAKNLILARENQIVAILREKPARN